MSWLGVLHRLGLTNLSKQQVDNFNSVADEVARDRIADLGGLVLKVVVVIVLVGIGRFAWYEFPGTSSIEQTTYQTGFLTGAVIGICLGVILGGLLSLLFGLLLSRILRISRKP